MEMVKTKSITGPIKEGTILRSDGTGRRLMRVVEVIKDDVMFESYGRLRWGRFESARRLNRIYGKIVWGKVVVYRHQATHSSYTPVELISKYYDAGDAYELGQRSKSYTGRNPFKTTELEQTWRDGYESVPR